MRTRTAQTAHLAPDESESVRVAANCLCSCARRKSTARQQQRRAELADLKWLAPLDRAHKDIEMMLMCALDRDVRGAKRRQRDRLET